MKDSVEKLHFFFFYEEYGLLFNEQKYPKVGFSLNDFGIRCMSDPSMLLFSARLSDILFWRS